jgi:TPR repeat protein
MQDFKKAFVLFKKAAQAGHPTAQFNLGAMYDLGWGCEEDKQKALEWCRKAAFAGHEKAKKIIQRMQQDGQIVF